MHDVVAVAVSVGRMRRKTCTALPPAKVGAVGAVGRVFGGGGDGGGHGAGSGRFIV